MYSLLDSSKTDLPHELGAIERLPLGIHPQAAAPPLLAKTGQVWFHRFFTVSPQSLDPDALDAANESGPRLQEWNGLEKLPVFL